MSSDDTILLSIETKGLAARTEGAGGGETDDC
jgi:hypothetical protein